MRYAVVIEQTGPSFRAYVPDLPGCISTGRTLAEAEASLRLVIRYHVEALRRDGAPVPLPRSQVDYVAISA
jgi:predicted RNase H-like HicB family nuclease